jgi:hypothetical protein
MTRSSGIFLTVSVICLLLVVSMSTTEAQGGYPTVYLRGTVGHLDGTDTNGSIYIWYDANEDGTVNFGDAELETATVVDGEWMSDSQYASGLPLIFQTHTEGDYVDTFEWTVPTGRVDMDYGDIFPVPRLTVRERDDTPIVRVSDQSGWNMLEDNFTIYSTLTIAVTFHVSTLKSLGQGGYFDLGAQREMSDWALCFYMQDNVMYPTDNYDYAMTDPIGRYYYYSLPEIDGQNEAGGFYTIITEWEVLGDTEVYMQINDPLWQMHSGTPLPKKPSRSTFKIEDWNCTPTGGEVEFYTNPTEVIYHTGGVVHFNPDEWVEGNPDGGSNYFNPTQEEIMNMLRSWTVEYPFPIPLMVVIWSLMFSKQGRKIRRRIFYGSFSIPRRRKRTKKHVASTEQEPTMNQKFAPLSTEVSQVPLPMDDKVWVVECAECGDPANNDQLEHDPLLGKWWECESCGRINVIVGTKE